MTSRVDPDSTPPETRLQWKVRLERAAQAQYTAFDNLIVHGSAIGIDDHYIYLKNQWVYAYQAHENLERGYLAWKARHASKQA